MELWRGAGATVAIEKGKKCKESKGSKENLTFFKTNRNVCVHP